MDQVHFTHFVLFIFEGYFFKETAITIKSEKNVSVEYVKLFYFIQFFFTVFLLQLIRMSHCFFIFLL